MKIISLFLSIFVFVQLNAQTNSYYFADPVPGEKVDRINDGLYGNYDDGKGRIYAFSDTGIVVLSTTVSSISRDYIRESSKYRVENGFLFGVLPKDSVPCLEEGDNYYFGIRNRDLLVGKGSSHILVRSSTIPNTYYLNLYENGIYSLIRLRFNKGKLEISNLEYEPDTVLFEKVRDQKSVSDGSLNLVLLKPTLEEFDSLIQAGIFGDPTIYVRVK